jgi:DNA-binding SARP family transcriptional activator/tetratricopeptide (TPR) repeat protein
VEFRILGSLEVIESGRTVQVRGPKQRALLAILVLSPNRVVPSDALIDLLWRGDPPAGALNTLQTHIAHLRIVLEPDRLAGAPARVLVTAPPGYLLAIDDDAVDARLFERLVRTGRDAMTRGDPAAAVDVFDRGLALWRGPALGDLATEPFAISEVSRLDELRLGAVEDRFDAELALGAHARIVPELEVAVNEQPLRERRWGQLMLGLYRCGRQADALRAFQRARDVLGEEIGIEPSPTLQRLERAVIRQSSELDWSPPVSASAADRLPPFVAARVRMPFIGRRPQLDDIARAIATVGESGNHLVLVSGEPGVGKSTLAAEAARRAHEDGSATVLWGRCLEDSLVEYQPFVEAIRPAIAHLSADVLTQSLGRGAVELSRLFPELASRLHESSTQPRIDPDTERYHLFEAVASALAVLSQRQTVMLVLDDLHAADRSTLLLLRHVVRRHGGRLLVVATYRHTEVEDAHPLTALAATLIDECRCTHYALGGLQAEEVADLVSSVAGRSAPPAFTRAIGEQTDGNPFFIVEILRHLTESRNLVDAAGEWLATAPLDHTGVPGTVADVIARRLARLDASTVRALDVAAVVGRDFDAELTGRAGDITEDELADALDQARVAGLVVETSATPARYAFAHALIRDALYGAIGNLRRAQLHRRVAEALEAAPEADTNLAELAHHYSRAGGDGRERAFVYARRAGEHSLRLLAYEEAVRHFEQALDLLDHVPTISDDERCDLLVAIGDAAVRFGAFTRAEEVLADAARIARSAGRPALLARVALACSGPDRQGLWVDYGLVAHDAVTLLEEALAAADATDDRLRARLLAHLALELYFSGDERRREETAFHAVQLARRSGDCTTLGTTLATCMRAVWGPDNMEERLAWAVEMLDLADASDDDELRLAAGWRIPTLLELGRVNEADAALESHAVLAEVVRHPLDRVWSRGLQGGRALRRGDFAETERLMTEGMQLAPDLFDTMQAFAGQFCTLRWEQGRCEETVGLAESFVGQFGHVPAWSAGLAVLYAGSGRVAAAIGTIEAVEAELDCVRRDQNWFFCMGALAEAIAVVGEPRLAVPVYDALLPYADRCVVLGDGFALLCAVTKSLGILARTMGSHELAAGHLRCALATHVGFGTPPLIARTQYEYGRVLLEAGDSPATARELLDRARVTASAIGMDAVVASVDALR